MFNELHVGLLPGPILIVSPHPDDDFLSSGGLIQRAIKLGKEVYIVYLTNGDANAGAVKQFLHRPLIPRNFIKLGLIRHKEAIRSEHALGVPAKHLIFLSFPDGISLRIARSRRLSAVFRSPCTHLGRAAYPFSYRVGAPYSKASAIHLIRSILLRIKPGTVVVNLLQDVHPDHKAARLLFLDSLKRSGLHPVLLSYLIHYPHWPARGGPFLPPPPLSRRNVLALKLTAEEVARARAAFRLEASEYRFSPGMQRLIRPIEYFWS